MICVLRDVSRFASILASWKKPESANKLVAPEIIGRSWPPQRIRGWPRFASDSDVPRPASTGFGWPHLGEASPWPLDRRPRQCEQQPTIYLCALEKSVVARSHIMRYYGCRWWKIRTRAGGATLNFPRWGRRRRVLSRA